jgi:glutathione S-transferase
MKLIASLTSPFARKVRIVLWEKQISCELQEDIPWNKDTQVPQFNPLGKVPVMVLDNGDSLYDSRVIVEYLDDIKPWPLMIPSLSEQRIAVKKWEALADGISDAAATIFLEKKRPESQQSPDWIARQYAKINNGLKAMNDELVEPFFLGNDYTLADITAGCALGYLSLRFPELDWRSTYPKLNALAERLEARESFQKTLAPR